MKRKLSITDSDDASSNSGGENEIVDVTFDFDAPKETDFLALKKLLNPLFPDCNALSEGVDAIISRGTNNNSGICVYLSNMDDDEEESKEIPDPVSITSLISLPSGLKEYLDTTLKSSTKATKWFINTRLINIPADIVQPSFKLLSEEKELQNANKSDLCCYVTRMYCMNGQWSYYQPEDELLSQKAKNILQFKHKQIKTDAVFYDMEITLCINLMDSFLAGSIASVVTRFVISPIDIVKIRTQISPPSTSVITITSSLLRKEGIFSLWKGNLSAIYLYVIYGGVQFKALDFIRPIVAEGTLLERNAVEGISGGLAASVATVTSYPFDTMRTHFASMNNKILLGETGGKSLIRMMQKTFAQEGISGFYKGLIPSIFQINVQMSSIFYIYAVLNEVSPDTRVANASTAGFLGKTIALPFDVIRKRMQVKQDSVFFKDGYTSMTDAIKLIWRKEGVRGMFRGLMVTCLKSAVSSAVTFYIFEHLHEK